MSKFLFAMIFASTAFFSQVAFSECNTADVGAAIARFEHASWNKGTVRAWEETGEFWSMPLHDLKQFAKNLQIHLEKDCRVHISDVGSFSARVLPKNVTKSEDASLESNFISREGTTLGVFQPNRGDLILIMYPAKIASVIARGTGTPSRDDLKEVLARFTPQLDIEYNFGGFGVRTFGGVGKMPMREAGDVVFRLLRKQGFSPAVGSEKSIAAFDGFFAPDHHESFWQKKDSIARVELEKLKNGQVRLNIHDDKDRSIGTKS